MLKLRSAWRNSCGGRKKKKGYIDQQQPKLQCKTTICEVQFSSAYSVGDGPGAVLVEVLEGHAELPGPGADLLHHLVPQQGLQPLPAHGHLERDGCDPTVTFLKLSNTFELRNHRGAYQAPWNHAPRFALNSLQKKKSYRSYIMK
jgi:hypothetical protein